MENQNTNIALVKSQTSIPMESIDINKGFPDLTNAQEVPMDLMSDYWTPEKAGESKKVFFDSIRERLVRDQQDPNVLIELPCAYFFEPDTEGKAKTISNGSKRLVGVIEAFGIQRGTPLLITYLGKKKNASNQYHSDQWSVKPLILNIGING